MKFKIETQGFTDIINITKEVFEELQKTKIKDGICLISCPGSTVGLTTIEYEEGALNDLKRILDKLVPATKDYEHCKKWPARQSLDGSRRLAGGGDCNGYAHIRSALIKPFLAVPIEEGNLVLGAWQQIVLIDFDNRPRTREIIIKIIKI